MQVNCSRSTRNVALIHSDRFARLGQVYRSRKGKDKTKGMGVKPRCTIKQFPDSLRGKQRGKGTPEGIVLVLLMTDRCFIEISSFSLVIPFFQFYFIFCCPSSLKEDLESCLVSDPPGGLRLGPPVSLLLFYPFDDLNPSSTFRFLSLSWRIVG